MTFPQNLYWRLHSTYDHKSFSIKSNTGVMEHILSRESPNIKTKNFGRKPPQTPRFSALVCHFIFLIKGYDFSSKPILAAT